VRERVEDARARYAELRGEAADVERELATLADRLETDLLPRCEQIRREQHAAAGAEQNALDALKKAGEPLERPTIGAPGVPSQEMMITFWKLVHRLIGDQRRAAFAQTK
jgi:hypothetical protein